MISTIKAGFDWLIGFFKGLFDFIIILVNGAIFVFHAVTYILYEVASFIGSLPPYLQTFAFLSLSLFVARIIATHNFGGGHD